MRSESFGTEIQKRLEEVESSQLSDRPAGQGAGHSCSALQAQGAMDRDRQPTLVSWHWKEGVRIRVDNTCIMLVHNLVTYR